MIKTIVFIGLGFVLGQYSIIYSYNPENIYKKSINLAVQSFNYGCIFGKNNNSIINCKEASFKFMNELISVKRM